MKLLPVHFDVSPTLGAKARNAMQLADEIAIGLGIAHVHVRRVDDTMRIEVPRFDHRVVSLLSLCEQLRTLPALTCVLGTDKTGKPLGVHLPTVGHVLIVGGTGAGKTEMLRTIVASLAYLKRPAECRMRLVGESLDVFAGLPHVIPPTEASYDMRVLVIDDLTRPFPPLETLPAGVHIVAATRDPRIDIGAGLTIVGRVPNKWQAWQASGLPNSGAQRLLGRGDFLAVQNGQATRFQASYIAEREIPALIERVAGRVQVALERAGAPRE